MPTIVKLPSGNWRAQVRRAGIYRNGTFETKREAKDWAAQIETQARQVAATGYARPPAGATFADLAKKYVEEVAPKGRTWNATIAMLRRDRIGAVSLLAFSGATLRDFIDRRRKGGAGGVTLAGDLSAIGAILKWGRIVRKFDLPAHLVTEERAALAARGMRLKSRERDRIPTPDELKRLFEHWAKNARQRIPMAVLVRFALATGMRLAEICNIQIEDVDAAARTVVIRDRKDPKLKAGNDQVVPLLPDAWAIAEPAMVGRESGALFPYRAASVSTAFTRAAAELGIEDLHFHDLRHAATTRFFAQGLAIPQVAVLTGHRSWAMLKRYVQISAGDVHAAFEKANPSQTQVA